MDQNSNQFGQQDQQFNANNQGFPADAANQGYTQQVNQSYQDYQNQANQNYQGYQNQGYQNQSDPNYQAYQNQGYPSQANQNYQGYQNQGYANQADQNYQGYQNQGYPNQANQNYQGYQNQGYANQADQNYQGYQNQSYPSQANQNYQGYQNQGYTNQAGQGLPNQSAQYQNQVPLSQFAEQQSNFGQEFQQPAYAGEVAAVKKKVNPAVIIIPIAVVVLAAAAVVLFMLLFGSVNYENSERNYFSNLFSTLSSAADEAAENYQPSSVEITVDAANSQISEYIEEYIGSSNISLTLDSIKSGNDVYSKMAILLGDMNFSGEFWFSNERGALLLPDISSIYMTFDLSESDAAGSEYTYDEIIEVFGELFSKTADTYFEIIGEPELIKNQELNVNGYTVNADKAEIVLSDKDVCDIALAFLENLKENDKALGIIAEYSGETKEEIISYLDEEIAEGKEAAEYASETEEALRMNVYISGGTVVGREVSIVTDGVAEELLKLYQFSADGENVTKLCIIIDDEVLELISIDSVSEEAHSGTFTLRTEDDSITVTYDDFAVTDELFQGTASICIASQPAFEISAALNAEGDTKTATVTVPNICTLSIIIKPSDLEFKEFPQLNEGEYFNIYDYDEYGSAYEQFENDIYSFIYGSSGSTSDDSMPKDDITNGNATEANGTEDTGSGTSVSSDPSAILGTWSISTMGTEDYEFSIAEIYGDDDEDSSFDWTFTFNADGTVVETNIEIYDGEEYGYTDTYNYEYDGKTITVLYEDYVLYTFTHYADDNVISLEESGFYYKFVK